MAYYFARVNVKVITAENFPNNGMYYYCVVLSGAD